jgi:hypothetical protein
MIQRKRKDGKMHKQSLDLSCAHLAMLALMVMTVKECRREVIQMERPRVTLYAYKTALQTTSYKIYLTPEDGMISGVNPNTMLKTLASVRCVKITAMGFFR